MPLEAGAEAEEFDPVSIRAGESGEHEVGSPGALRSDGGGGCVTDPRRFFTETGLGEVEIEGAGIGGSPPLDGIRAKLMTGTITAFEPQRVLAFTWRSKRLPPSHVRWEMSA